MQFYINVGTSCFWSKSSAARPHLTVTLLEPECIKCAQFWRLVLRSYLTIFKRVDKMHILDYCCQATSISRTQPYSLGVRKHICFPRVSPKHPAVTRGMLSPRWRGHGHSRTGRQACHDPPSRQAALGITHAGRSIFFHSIRSISSNLQ